MTSQPSFNFIDHYCLAKRASTVDYPFDETTRVYRVANKIFALLSEELDPMRINLKCDPEDAEALRAQYPAIIPGYHMNKKHWNTVILNGSLSEELLQELIDQSNYLIVSSLSKSKRAEFNL